MDAMSADAVHAFDQLERLAAEPDRRSFAVRLHLEKGRPTSLAMVDEAAPVLAGSVLTAPNTGGRLWLPWPSPITPINDVETTADRMNAFSRRSAGSPSDRRDGTSRTGPRPWSAGLPTVPSRHL
ncbi:hypothetical protein ACQPYK_44700 [Streptosporangium sp. CA-135522]|uniref:hypothetical protein n=1 Tax=Streptosporangium sp. CA-135522 TaxID=3240072 RepID=UPI003D8C956C